MLEPKLEPSVGKKTTPIDLEAALAAGKKKFGFKELCDEKLMRQLALVAADKVFDEKQSNDVKLFFVKSLCAYERPGASAVEAWWRQVQAEASRLQLNLDFGEFYSYLYLRGTNSNTMSQNSNDSVRLRQQLTDYLTQSGKEEAARLTLNPFGLHEGQIIYGRGDDGAPVEFKIDEILVEGNDGAAIFNGRDISLSKLNSDLVVGKYVASDGEAFWGDLGKERKNMISVFDCPKVEATFKTPFGELVGVMETVSTNEAELEKKYGRAYLMFLPALFKAKVKVNGVEKEVGLKDMQFLSEWKRLD